MPTTYASHPSTRYQSWPPGPSGPVVDVVGLVKRYGSSTGVDGVDLHVEPGEIFGLLGTNGAGKTTTVECLQGLRRGDAGHIRVLGLDPRTDRDRLRTMIGSQLQDAALPDRLRVGEAIRLFDRSDRTDIGPLLVPWGLRDHGSTAFADLSGGQRQRLLVCLAVLNQPRLVFLDELTQGLDPAARRNVWHHIAEIRNQGTTVVLVSHFADEIEALCDRVAVMANGRIVDTGTPAELTARHAHATTIAFTPPASFDPSHLQRIVGVRTIERSGDTVTVSGTDTMIAAVCAATLDDHGHGPTDLRVTHPTLDDALVNLIGAPR